MVKARLSCSPPYKKITYPVWRDEEKHYFFVKDITGHIAMWATRQSPYCAPSNIEQAIEELDALLRSTAVFQNTDIAHLTGDELKTLLDENIVKIPLIVAWNNPKREWRKCGAKSINEHPDFDFIDLHAMVQNATISLMLEAIYNRDQDWTPADHLVDVLYSTP